RPAANRDRCSPALSVPATPPGRRREPTFCSGEPNPLHYPQHYQEQRRHQNLLNGGSQMLMGGERSRMVNVIEMASGTNYVLARHREYHLYNHYFSPDGKWMAFEARNKPDRNRLHIVPFRDRSEVPESEWITV